MLRAISESLVWSGVSVNGADAAVTLLLCYCGRRRACERGGAITGRRELGGALRSCVECRRFQ